MSIRKIILPSVLGVVLVQLTLLAFSATVLASSPLSLAAAPTISNVRIVTPAVARNEKFEAQFDVTTSATYPDLRFEPNPPPGVKPGIGVSVDVQFTHDQWKTTITQPAFLYQPYAHTIRYGQDHWTPDGAPRWAVRFAPKESGEWQFRIHVRDAGGETVYPLQGSAPFRVNPASGGRYTGLRTSPYTERGFLRVSQDPRYFEFEDGTPFIGVGFNTTLKNPVQANETLHLAAKYQVNFVRAWLSSAGINGSQWSSWASNFVGQDGYIPNVHFDTTHTFEGADVAYKLDASNPCFFAEFWQGEISVEPNETYRVTARVKLNNITPNQNAGARGFVIKVAPWLKETCAENTGTLVTPPLIGTTDWMTTTGLIHTAPDQYFLNYLYLARQNVAEGEVYIDDIRLTREDDPNHVNQLREPNANSHLTFDRLNAAAWDLIIDNAAQNGVYLKLVTDEKGEWIKNHISPEGVMTAEGNNNNFYAAPGTKVRWLEEAWWRYLIARWGYSTAIHSFEYVNEGDPYNGNHYDAAAAMARYFDEHDPNQHMVTTSFWHSFPNLEFWSNPAYSAIDYADLHAYISTGWGTTAAFVNPAMIEPNAVDAPGGVGAVRINGGVELRQPITPRGLVIRGPGEWTVRYWMKGESFTADCPNGSTGGMERVRVAVGQVGAKPIFQSVIPPSAQGDEFNCSSPGGTFDWKELQLGQDRTGQSLPNPPRLILSDTVRSEISLSIENFRGTGGTALISDVELLSPNGQVVPVIGQFDPTRMDLDTAWFNRAYGDLFGGASPVGAQKPLVRGETALDTETDHPWNSALRQDTEAIWLHNWVWGQINPGGMYDLLWYPQNVLPEDKTPGRVDLFYRHFSTYRTFMRDIPLNNGHYKDANAVTSNPALRAWGQRDDENGRIHLWIQNRDHQWDQVIAGKTIQPVSGTVTLEHLPAGTYRVEWWDTYRERDQIFLTQTITVQDTLKLQLPEPLSTDVAVKIEREK